MLFGWPKLPCKVRWRFKQLAQWSSLPQSSFQQVALQTEDLPIDPKSRTEAVFSWEKKVLQDKRDKKKIQYLLPSCKVMHDT